MNLSIIQHNRRTAQRGYTSAQLANMARERIALSALLLYVFSHEAYKWWKKRNRWSTKLERETARYAKRVQREARR